MPVIPQIRVNGKVPKPDGTDKDAAFSLGTNLTLSLASTVGIGSVEWRAVGPASSAADFTASRTPGSPFSTTFGALDVLGTWLFTCIANGDPQSVKTIAIAVRSEHDIRIPAVGEDGQWDPVEWWGDGLRGVIELLDGMRKDGAAYVDVTGGDPATLTPKQWNRRFLEIEGTGHVIFPDKPGAAWIVFADSDNVDIGVGAKTDLLLLAGPHIVYQVGGALASMRLDDKQQGGDSINLAVRQTYPRTGGQPPIECLVGMGAPSESIFLTVAQLTKAYPRLIFRNGTTSGHNVTVKSANVGDAGVLVAPSTQKALFFDHTTGQTRSV